MSITAIREHADIVIENTALTTREEWLELRRQGIGGSDAAAVLGLTKWSSPYALWEEKVGNIPSDLEPSNAMKWGIRLEQAIGEGFAEDTGIEVVRYPVMLRSKQWPWMQVNLDFITADATATVECKNVGLRMADEWEDGNVPDHYALQGQHELAVTGQDTVWFAVLIGGQEPRYVKVERDQALIETLAEEERIFWEMVKANTPPAVDGSQATADALALRYADPEIGSAIDLPLDTLKLLQRREALKADEKYVKAEILAIDNELKAMLGEKEVGYVNGQVVATWKKIDRKGYTVEPTSFRKLHTPKRK